eukprot:1785101-Amphidinium_carterae.1
METADNFVMWMSMGNQVLRNSPKLKLDLPNVGPVMPIPTIGPIKPSAGPDGGRANAASITLKHDKKVQHKSCTTTRQCLAFV